MKKFMFSAIAMIAFVGSSMASDIAEKDVELMSNDYNSCIQEAIFKVNEDEIMFGCLTPTQYEFLLQSYYRKCKSANNPC